MMRIRSIPLIAAWISLLPSAALAWSCAGTPRCEKLVVASSPYNYRIAATGKHCTGAAATCPAAPGDKVPYSWPVTNPESETLPHDALEVFLGGIADQIFTLPFLDTRVKRVNGWLYGPGNWHHAVDYARSDGSSFPVRAAAAGVVIFADWDDWSGNTVIVSHDVAGTTDAYRTIYMHLRNGPQNDCALSWSRGLAAVGGSGSERDKYKAHLNSTGCPEQVNRRHPWPAQWGTDDHKLDAQLIGRVVAAGDQLGWAGATGPGGQKTVGPPNTHLHIFFARKQASDDHWYFFDPYGIYGLPHCYPSGVTEAPSGFCVRLPVAWKDGRPQYPNAAPGCGNGPACPGGLSCTNGLCLPACTPRCPLQRGCFRNGNGDCRRTETFTDRQGCSGPLGSCPFPCFRDGGGACKKDVPKTREAVCALECVP